MNLMSTETCGSPYQTAVYNLIYLLQYRVRKQVLQEPVHESKFRRVLLSTYEKTEQLEQAGDFKFSRAMKDLADLL